MNAYTFAALPPALLLIVDPELWPWALALAAFVTIAALAAFVTIAALAAFVTIAALAGAAWRFRDERNTALAEVARLERELETAALWVGGGPAVVTPKGDGGMDQLLLEALATPRIPAQRQPGGAS